MYYAVGRGVLESEVTDMWYVLGGMVVGVVMIVAAEVCVAKYA